MLRVIAAGREGYRECPRLQRTTRSSYRIGQRQGGGSLQPLQSSLSESGPSSPSVSSADLVSLSGCIRSSLGRLVRQCIEGAMDDMQLTRRNILRGRLGPEAPPVCPPGVSTDGLAACTSCGACVLACPPGIVALADGKPSIDFSRGECTLCGKCGDVCPEPVFDRSAPAAFGHVMCIADSCLALHRTDCQSCRDHCPVDAIRFKPQLGGPFRPVLDPEICNGCGACLSVCPIGAIGVAPLTRGDAAKGNIAGGSMGGGQMHG